VLNVGQQILFNVTGQSLYFDVPEGRPSSVTDVQVWEDSQSDEGQEESATTGSASIDSVNTTFSAASGDGQQYPDRLNLTSLTGVAAGRQYLATNALYGQKEWVEIASVGSSYAIAVSPLAHPYAAADTFVGTRITISLSSAWVQDKNNVSDPLCPRPLYRAVWTYVVGGVTYRGASYFDLVRYPFVTTVIPADVDRGSRGWLQRLPIDARGGNGELIIDEAVQQVKLDLWEREVTAYALRNSEVVNELIRRKAVALVSRMAVQAGGIRVDVADADDAAYWERLDNLVGQAKAAQQVTADGAAATTRRSPIWRR